jgi:hypothetical protein
MAGTIDTLKASLVARLHAWTPRDMLLCFLGAFADVLLFEAATVADACQLALEWARRAIQTGGPLPVAMLVHAAWGARTGCWIGCPMSWTPRRISPAFASVRRATTVSVPTPPCFPRPV